MLGRSPPNLRETAFGLMHLCGNTVELWKAKFLGFGL